MTCKNKKETAGELQSLFFKANAFALHIRYFRKRGCIFVTMKNTIINV